MGAVRVPVDQRRADLVDAAFTTMAAVGIKKATTRAICAEAGVHQSVFHYCFHSKAELYQELIKAVVVDMVDEALAPSSDTAPGASAHDAIVEALRRIWTFATSRPDRQLVAYELTTLVMRDPDLTNLAAWQYQQYFEQGVRFARGIEQSTGVSWTVPLPVLARMLTTSIDGLVLGWLADRDDETAEAALMTFADLFAGLTRSASNPAR